MSDDELYEALAGLRQGLHADGADLEVSAIENGTLHVRLVLGDETCSDCIVDKPMLEGLIQRAAAACDGPAIIVVLEDPRPPRRP